jgi:hypothetical protein
VAFRNFIDSAGNEWQAFDVVPRALERRSAERRSGSVQTTDLEAERREADRRLTVGGRSPGNASMRSGWLVFERGADRRRLSPIPENWQRLTDSELDVHLRIARQVDQKKSAAS